MISDLFWRLRRVAHFASRLGGSIASRGWRDTLKRLFQERARLFSIFTPSSTHTSALAINGGVTHRPDESGKRLLVVDSMTPDPSRDSGSLRLCRIFELMHQDGWHIDFFADDGFATPADISRLAAIGVAVRQGNLLSWLRSEGKKLDAVLLCRLPVANQYLDVVRRYAPLSLTVFDTVDLHYIRERRAAEITGNRRLRRRAKHTMEHELKAISRSDITLVVSAEEQVILAQELPVCRVELLTNIHDIHDRDEDFETRRDLLFVGGFGHPPNADAMQWFVAEILPLLRKEEPELMLHIVGDIDSQSKLALERDGVQIHGRVNDLTPLMNHCRISVAPLRFGAGVKGKVNMAMSYGLPVVVTSIAAEGMYLENNGNAMIADNAEDFASATLSIYRDKAKWLRISDAGLENIRAHFSIEKAQQTLQKIFTGITRPH